MASIDGIPLSFLDELAKQCYLNSKEHGFYEDFAFHTSIESVRSYWGNKFMLIAGEVAEAHEELRDGRGLTEIYYNEDKPTKPEGVTAEIIDILIRSLDFLGFLYVEKGFAPSEIFEEKFNYNVSREKMHGRRF